MLVLSAMTILGSYTQKQGSNAKAALIDFGAFMVRLMMFCFKCASSFWSSKIK
jgi:hypothetical protein